MIVNINPINLATLSATLLGGIYLLTRKQNKNVPKMPMYKCLFLTEEGVRGEFSTEIMFNMLTPIVDFINESEKSIDLCFYIISDIKMINAVIKAKERNVKVRIITDYNTGIVNNKYAQYFYKEGIPVYAKNVNASTTIMHNKFVIRDDKIILQASLNLTKNTSKGSYDNIIITDDPHVVVPFMENFDKLVLLFDYDDTSESNESVY